MNLPRTLEPEVMETTEEAATYDTMDHSDVNRQFVDDLLAVARPSDELLDLGTGNAQIPIELCRRTPQVRIVAVDLSVNMMDIARVNLEIAGLIDRVMLDCVDAKSLPYEDGRFSAVISNSLIHHLREPQAALREAVRMTAPTGYLFVRDLRRPSSAQAVDALVAQYAGHESDHAQQLFHDSLHAALTIDEMRDIVGTLGFGNQTVQATSDRHWTWAAAREEAGTAEPARSRH